MDMASQHKHRELEALLQRGVVMVHLDPRVDGVVVPPQFTQEEALRLNVAYAFNLPSFEISEDGVYAILSFDGQNFGCTIPWRAMYALTLPQESHEGMVWPDSMPVELRDATQTDSHPSDDTRADEVSGSHQGKPAFAVLRGGKEFGSAEATKTTTPAAERQPNRNRNHLTLVKG
jgi:stringent starvation protein B